MLYSGFGITVCWFCVCYWRYLIEHGAHVGAVNSEGELPLDVATEDAMERLLKGEIKKQGEDLLWAYSKTSSTATLKSSVFLYFSPVEAQLAKLCIWFLY